MHEKITILFLTTDLKLIRDLQERTKSFLAEFVFVPCTSGSRISEYGKKI